MRFAIMGAGAVGCYYGARLALAGHDVVLIGRPALVEAVRADGLRLEMGGETRTAAVEADEHPSGIAGADVVLFCVKSGDTETAAGAILPHLDPRARVLVLQNGVSNSETLERVLDRHVVTAAVYVASRMAGHGTVRHEGRGDLAIGGPGAAQIAEVLDAAGIATAVSDDVMASLWEKLVINCVLNPLSAVTRLPYGRIIAEEGLPALMEDVAREALAVARAEGHAVSEHVLDVVRSIPEAMPDQVSSTAQDILRGRATEIEHLNGEVVRRAARHGIAVPHNRTLYLMTKLAEKTIDVEEVREDPLVPR